jgi:toxin-antitoxin system PIN domain toxin
MKLADSNVWLALAISKHIFHDAVRAWMATQTAPKGVLFCRSTQQSFLRLLTTAAVLQPYGSSPLTNRQAWNLYAGLLADSRVGWSDEPPGLESHWNAIATLDTPSPKLWMDAYLAAFAIAGQHQLVTTDKAFQQHAGLDLLVLSQTPTQP